jgi:hypothetical protein
MTCTTKVAYSSCGTPSYAYSETTSSCPYVFHIFTLGAVQSMAFTGTPGNCKQWDNTSTNYTFYSIGAEIDASMFAQGTLMTQ